MIKNLINKKIIVSFNKNNEKMKKMMMIAAMAVACLTANAQNEVGQFTLQPKVGLNFANLSGANYATTGSTTENSNIMVDFALGVEAEYGLSKNFSVAAGIMYSRQGCDYGEYTTSNSGWDKNQRKLGYLTIPIVANFYFAKGFAIKAGIQPGFLLSANAKIDGKGTLQSEDIDIKDACNSFDLSIPLGLSYETDNVVIDARYNLGLTKINKSKEDIQKLGLNNLFNRDYDDCKNSVIQFTIGYKFAL